MDTESDTEAGGQTDDSGDTGDEADEGGSDTETTPVDRPTGDKPARGGRTQRRKDAMREATIAREAAEREREEWRQRHTQTESQLAELRARLEERERSTQTQDKNAERKTKIGQLRERAKSHLLLSAQAKDQATANAEWQRHQELMDEAEDMRREMWAEQERERIKQEMRGQMPDVSMMEDRQYFNAKHPWLATNIAARSAADGRFIELVQAGRPNNRQTLEEAVTWAAKVFKLGGNGHIPTDASRQRYVGTGQRDGEQDDGASGGTMTADDVRNSLQFKRMALGAFPQLEPEQAYAKWAKEIGSKAMKGA